MLSNVLMYVLLYYLYVTTLQLHYYGLIYVVDFYDKNVVGSKNIYVCLELQLESEEKTELCLV